MAKGKRRPTDRHGRHEPATRCDLQAMEERLAELIRSGGISAEDQADLDKLLARTARIAKKLEKLDALTP